MMHRLILLFLLIAVTFTPVQAQNGDIPDNAAIVTAHISDLLKDSRIVAEINTPFSLVSNFPDRHMLVIYESLLGINKKVRLEPGDPTVQLRLFTSNSLSQIDKEMADRVLSGELHILYIESESVINETEKLTFTYSDKVPVRIADMLESTWQGGAFQEKNFKDERNLWRQVGQPAIIAAATGVTVFLLFNIRAN